MLYRVSVSKSARDIRVWIEDADRCVDVIDIADYFLASPMS
jgi:hypothetical protein